MQQASSSHSIMQQSSLSLRDEALLPLTKVLTRQQISTLLFEDVAVVDPKTKYIEGGGTSPSAPPPGDRRSCSWTSPRWRSSRTT